ncbi:MAG TPA: periplasmic heavy metal sensor [Thermoanaerobaculia bacterium]|jgi:Spy/CpxP family protein refolding chaperone|nr:periplasmic heavy metal sensor [Thermoanaerobaculia bacterium]
MKRSTLTITILALVALIAAPFLYANHGRDHGMAGFGPLAHLQRAQKELGLSDQQVDEIKAIFKSFHDQNADYRDQLRGGFQGVVNTLIKNPNDIAAAQALIDQQAQAERALKTNLLNAASKALNVLTPDQRTKLGQMIADRMAQRHQRQF